MGGGVRIGMLDAAWHFFRLSIYASRDTGKSEGQERESTIFLTCTQQLNKTNQQNRGTV